MKAFIKFCLFFTLASTLSCSYNTYDSSLLEIKNNPSSEAIFATMSMQLRSNGGFERVLALLNELVDDGKKQLHDARKIWSATSARCDVSKMKFQERQGFYENRLKTSTLGVQEADADSANCSEMVSSLGRAREFFQNFLEAESQLHQQTASRLTDRVNYSKAAVEQVDSALDSVQNWTPEQTALIEQSLHRIAASYLQIHKYNIVIPHSFVQTAASDEAVKLRLIEWLSSLKTSFLEVQSDAENLLAERGKLAHQIEKEIYDLLSSYEADIKTFEGKHHIFVEQQEAMNKAVSLFEKLVSENSALIEANDEYCSVEKSSFEKAQEVLESQVKLFKDTRAYFQNNYQKINQFVKEKYNTPQ